MNSTLTQERIIALRKKRSAQDLRFKYYGFIAMCLALAVLVFLLYSIFSRGFTAFQKTTILLEINYDQEVLKLTPDSTEQEIEIQTMRTVSDVQAYLMRRSPEHALTSAADCSTQQFSFRTNVDGLDWVGQRTSSVTVSERSSQTSTRPWRTRRHRQV